MNERDFDAIDVLFIQSLRRDGRERMVTLAKRANIPSSTAYDRLVRLRKLGVRFVPLIDWSYLGCSLTVCFITAYNADLMNHPNVNTCVRVSPDALFIECVFASMLEVEQFQNIVSGAKIYPVVEILKKEGFVPELFESRP